MNWSHLKTFLWLKSRLEVNHHRRHGMLSVIAGIIIKIVAALCAVAALVTGFLVGSFVLPEKPVEAIMTIWDGVVIAYLTFILIGIMVELQRSDMLSMNKFLHLPVTPVGGFLINYIGSNLNLSVLAFFAGMTGLAAGQLVAMGGSMLLLVPLVAGFFLMMTALTYQFRGWLASMWDNPRRRQTVAVIMAMAFMLVFMLPYVAEQIGNGRDRTGNGVDAPAVTAVQVDKRETPRFEPGQRRPPLTDIEIYSLQTRARFANAILPPGWLVHGVISTLEGRIYTALACVVGMIMIGGWSLWRSYRTTLRMYQGYFSAGMVAKKKTTVKDPRHTRTAAATVVLPAMRLPWISEQASAIAVAGFRAWLRSPEMKITILSPLIMLVVVGGMIGAREGDVSEYLMVLQTLGITAFMLFCIVYLMTNLFAYDRSGFRAFVLSPATRRDVLLGKNLSLFPFASGLVILAVGVCQWLAPLRPEHLAAVLVQALPVYLLYCMIGNTMSIYLPLVVKPGTAMPATGQSLKLLLRFLAVILSLVPLSLMTIPLGIEYLMSLLEWDTWFPTFLVFSLVQAVLMLWLYSLFLNVQAEWLYRREQNILEVVTTNAE